MSDVMLRTRVEGDEELLYRALTDLEDWEQRSPRPPRPVTREAFRARLAERATDDSRTEFVIEADGAAVGRCELYGVDPLARHAEVGISLVAEGRGRGIGTEALRQLVEFAFVRQNLHRLHLIVLATNLGAIRSYERVGFVEEGRRREHAWARGDWVDEVVMGLLRADWYATRG